MFHWEVSGADFHQQVSSRSTFGRLPSYRVSFWWDKSDPNVMGRREGKVLIASHMCFLNQLQATQRVRRELRGETLMKSLQCSSHFTEQNGEKINEKVQQIQWSNLTQLTYMGTLLYKPRGKRSSVLPPSSHVYSCSCLFISVSIMSLCTCTRPSSLCTCSSPTDTLLPPTTPLD